MESIVTLHSGSPVVSSTAIAEGIGREHKPVIRLIRENLSDFEEFGPLRFENAVALRPQGGGEPTTYALLNEPQATLLLTYMRNNEVVRAFKKRLVRAFYEMAEELRGPKKKRALNKFSGGGDKLVRIMGPWRTQVEEQVCRLQNRETWKRAFWQGLRRRAGYSGARMPEEVRVVGQYALQVNRLWDMAASYQLLIRQLERIYLRHLRGEARMQDDVDLFVARVQIALERLEPSEQLNLFER